MQSPNDRFEDGFVNGADKAAPPRMKLVRPSGDVEVLKPVAAAPQDVQEKPAPDDDNSADPLSHRALAIGAGAVVALLAFALLSGIFFGIQDPVRQPAEPGLSQSEPQAEKAVRAPKEPGPFESFPTEAEPTTTAERAAPEAGVRDASFEKRYVAEAAFRRSRHRPLPRPKMVTSTFVPTKLVIYAEDGVIKSRIEPQLAAFSKPPMNFSN